MPRETISGRAFPNVCLDQPSLLCENTRLRAVSTYSDIIWHNRQAGNRDESLYTGGPGIAFAYLKCGEVERAKHFLVRSPEGGQQSLHQAPESWLDKTARSNDPELPTSLLCGHAGVLFVELYLAWIQSAGRHDKAAVQQLSQAYLRVRTTECSSNEWLYGKAGMPPFTCRTSTSCKPSFPFPWTPTSHTHVGGGRVARR
jgi:hypothetical protein